MYFLMKQNEEAMKYIHEAETLQTRPGRDPAAYARTQNAGDQAAYSGLGIFIVP